MTIEHVETFTLGPAGDVVRQILCHGDMVRRVDTYVAGLTGRDRLRMLADDRAMAAMMLAKDAGKPDNEGITIIESAGGLG